MESVVGSACAFMRRYAAFAGAVNAAALWFDWLTVGATQPAAMAASSPLGYCHFVPAAAAVSRLGHINSLPLEIALLAALLSLASV